MRFSYEWLKDFIETPSLNKLVETVNFNIAEVDQMSKIDQSQVLVGHVKKISKIEGKKFYLAIVNIGKKNIQIVFQHRDQVDVDDLIPTAIAPTYLPTGEKIESEKIHGNLSEGMFMSNEELGLGKSEHFITKFKSKNSIGDNVFQELGLTSQMIKLSVTPNRGDLLSVYGLSRDIAAVMNRKLNQPTVPKLTIDQKYFQDEINININASGAVKRYTALKISSIDNLRKTPKTIQKRLLTAGLRPVNPVVDCTNYVMLELGQPIHAFDFEKFSESGTNRGQQSGQRKIEIRRSQENEIFDALNGKKYQLPAGAVVITDTKKIIALGGIIGSSNSSVIDKTKHIVIESAIFDEKIIRQTSRALDLTTDASYRFERKVDPATTVTALKRVTGLIQEICGGTISSNLFDTGGKTQSTSRKISLDLELYPRLIGQSIQSTQAEASLKRLGFTIAKKGSQTLELIPPSWRHDITHPQDVVEELLRVSGLNNVASTLPHGRFSPPTKNVLYNLNNQVANKMAALGWFEVINFSFTEIENYPTAVRLQNPINKTMTGLRSDLISGLVNSFKKNYDLDPSFQHKLFEIGHVFTKDQKQINETNQLAGLVFDKIADQAVQQVNTALSTLVPNSTIKPKENHLSDIMINKKVIGQVVVVDRTKLKWDKKNRAGIAFAINLDNLLTSQKRKYQYQASSIFPSASRDLNINRDKTKSIGKIVEEIKKSDKLITEVEVINIHSDNNKNNFTVRIRFRSFEKTLTDEVDKIINKLEKKYNK